MEPDRLALEVFLILKRSCATVSCIGNPHIRSIGKANNKTTGKRLASRDISPVTCDKQEDNIFELLLRAKWSLL